MSSLSEGMGRKSRDRCGTCHVVVDEYRIYSTFISSRPKSKLLHIP